MLLKPVSNGEYRTDIRALFLEYIGRVVEEMNQRWDFGWNGQDVEAFVEGDMQTIERLLPPNGRFYLAQVAGQFVGVGCLKRLDEATGEVKRMFVRQQFRGQGIGKMILDQLLADARSLGYARIFLDSPLFCKKAQLLYQARGFRYIDESYPGNENPEENHHMFKFMQLDL